MEAEKLTKEMLEKAKSAKSAEELLRLAKDNDVALEPAEAQKFFAALQQSRNGELNEAELEMAAGGRNTDHWYKLC